MTEIGDRVQSKIDDLRKDGSEMHDDLLEYQSAIHRRTMGNKVRWEVGNSEINRFSVLNKYEKWYNSARPLVAEYLPDRLKEFEEAYEKVRKGTEVDLEFIENKEINSDETLKSVVANSLAFQLNLLSSIPDRVETEQLKAKKEVSSKITSDEIQKSKELFDDDHIRAAGVITGVAIERHLLTLCESSNQELSFGYMDGITALAQELSEANEISDDDKRLLDYLSGIRNKCSHASDENPEKREVERMLKQADEFISS